jgi:hypothetical protein
MLIVTDSSAAGRHLPAAAWRRCMYPTSPAWLPCPTTGSSCSTPRTYWSDTGANGVVPGERSQPAPGSCGAFGEDNGSGDGSRVRRGVALASGLPRPDPHCKQAGAPAILKATWRGRPSAGADAGPEESSC